MATRTQLKSRLNGTVACVESMLDTANAANLRAPSGVYIFREKEGVVIGYPCVDGMFTHRSADLIAGDIQSPETTSVLFMDWMKGGDDAAKLAISQFYMATIYVPGYGWRSHPYPARNVGARTQILVHHVDYDTLTPFAGYKRWTDDPRLDDPLFLVATPPREIKKANKTLDLLFQQAHDLLQNTTIEEGSEADQVLDIPVSNARGEVVTLRQIAGDPAAYAEFLTPVTPITIAISSPEQYARDLIERLPPAFGYSEEVVEAIDAEAEESAELDQIELHQDADEIRAWRRSLNSMEDTSDALGARMAMEMRAKGYAPTRLAIITHFLPEGAQIAMLQLPADPDAAAITIAMTRGVAAPTEDSDHLLPSYWAVTTLHAVDGSIGYSSYVGTGIYSEVLSSTVGTGIYSEVRTSTGSTPDITSHSAASLESWCNPQLFEAPDAMAHLIKNRDGVVCLTMAREAFDNRWATSAVLEKDAVGIFQYGRRIIAELIAEAKASGWVQVAQDTAGSTGRT